MKSNSMNKLKKSKIAVTALLLCLLCLTSFTSTAKADTPAGTPLSNETNSSADSGLWTGKDGDCDWKFDLVTKTLTISAPAKTSQLSSTPFKKEFNWSDIIEHSVFETPVSLASDSSSKFADLRSLQDIKG
ncbi:hypothetical protein, partial [Lactobacillus sp.]|uniref:hypothetical protein n=1 Tax=Lactobacillus sp. TaxID=1591 RepID=UPI0025852699